MLGFGWAATASSSVAPAENKHEKPYALIFGTVWGPDNRPLYAEQTRRRRTGSSIPTTTPSLTYGCLQDKPITWSGLT